jgi:hypothetical protein
MLNPKSVETSKIRESDGLTAYELIGIKSEAVFG